ncbi:MAG TPA: sulfotransferase [Nocardioidaceae bacterium]|nr:sulfotransferase [Nocardioidaceae bacterium]
MSRHFLVIGGQRCGTTYLHTMLEAHPDICMARPARPEPKVFLDAEASARGLEWYRRTYFAHASGESRWGEKSTSYIESAEAATRAAGVLGDADILVLLRDPVLRAVSNWRFSTDNGFETRPLTEALETNLREARTWDAGATSVSPFAYLERGRFAAYLEPWLAAFPGRVRLHFLAEIVTDEKALAQVYDGLGVDPDFRPESLGAPVNQSEEPAPDLDPDLVRRVRAYFADSDRRLASLVGRALPWPSTA